jgi:cation diffusion facilitator CzcD-associated flavoprotein CzcO
MVERKLAVRPPRDDADVFMTRWFENRYPGCACDVPSHAYTYPWAPNPDWPRFLAESKDIVAYIDKVIKRFGLAKYIKVNHQIASCRWDDARGKWKVKVQVVQPKSDWGSKAPLEVLSEFEDECDVLLHGTGILNRWDYPDIPGLWDFKGRVSLLKIILAQLCRRRI